MKELQSLGLSVELLYEEPEDPVVSETSMTRALKT